MAALLSTRDHRVSGGDPDLGGGAGGFTFAPRGRAHAFVVTSETARVLAIQTPGSGQAFYQDASQAVDESGAGPVDFDRIREVAAATGATTIIGPPPFEVDTSKSSGD